LLAFRRRSGAASSRAPGRRRNPAPPPEGGPGAGGARCTSSFRSVVDQRCAHRRAPGSIRPRSRTRPAGLVGGRAQTRFVSWTPSYPGWLAPSRIAVTDLQWLAYRAYVEGSVPTGGMAAAVAWVQGGRSGPVTDRGERPVTRELAVAEMWAAVAVADECRHS
jgi:hypothetical protein